MTDFANPFAVFSVKVHERFNAMQKHNLFETINGNDLWLSYLSAFPEGTNPIFRTNTEHDCSCCKQFVRNIGAVVALKDGKRMTVWDCYAKLEEPYRTVARRLHVLIQLAPITALFKASEPTYGAVFSRETLEDGQIKRWNHFHAVVQANHQSKQVGKEQGELAGAVQVFRRGLLEIPYEIISDVKELIAENAIYRGAEHSSSIAAFLELKEKFTVSAAPNDFIWEHAYKPGARIRNSAIGTLLVDLTEGKPLEEAVKAFEAKVAPMSYKRTTALVTPSMVKAAAKQIEALGLEDALDRRYAVIGDVTINNVLFVDRGSKGKLRAAGAMGVLESMIGVAAVSTSSTKMLMDSFLKSVLPEAEKIEVLMKNDLQNNLVSLTAPVHLDPQDPSKLFKWNNDFGWSYNGNIADSNIKELVRKAGGNVTNAKLRMSLAWYNSDDLDLHCITPAGKHIFYAQKESILDVDMNAGYSLSRNPVENQSFTHLQDGVYQFYVEQYNPRDTGDKGFALELENNGQVHNYQSRGVGNRGTKFNIHVNVKNGLVIKVDAMDDIKGGAFSTEVWGIETEKFVKVNTVMLSPNHWDDQRIGNKHVFFMLEGCKNPDSTRGIYNEFLKSSLEEHRKVFEMLGDKSKCPPSQDQLSGVGFSSTKSDEVVVAVTSGGQRRQYSLSF